MTNCSIRNPLQPTLDGGTLQIGPRRHWWFCMVALVLMILPRTSSQSPKQQPRRTQQGYSIDYHRNPEFHWMIRLEDDESLLHGNAIVQSPYDDNVVYVTTHSGKLVVLSAQDGSTIATVTPKPRSLTEDGKTDTWSANCSSGVTFGELKNGDKFVAYSINDVPPEGSLYGLKTRVIAVSIPDFAILWSSSGLPGKANGSPVLYRNRKDGTPYVLLTHNSRLIKPDNSTITTGHITLLQAVNGHVVWTDSEWNRAELPLGYGPPGLAPNPLLGKYTGGLYNKNDLVVWTSADGDGRGGLGYMFAFQLSSIFQETDQQVSDLSTQVLKKVRWNAVTPPVFSANGTDMFVGVTGSGLRGWIGETRFDETAVWASNLVITESDPMAAIPTAPKLSNDEKRLFVSTASTDMHCVNTQDGQSMWDMSGTSPFLAEARVSTDDQRVYLIQSADGRIFCHNQLTGELLWLASCDQFEEDCANSVLADFDLSRTGQHLYYGDVMGRIVALELGKLIGDAGEPTGPMGPGVSPWPSDANGEGEEKSKSRTTLSGGIALIVFASAIATGIVMYILVMNRYKFNAQHSREWPPLDDGTMDDYALPNDPANAPDPYEDTMISQHQMSPKHLSADDTWCSYEDESHSKSNVFEDASDNISYAPSDRMSILLGTSNRIAPLREDFGYGASVLV